MITNIGKLLQKERENRNFTLQDVEKATHIRLNNLKAIEEENWDHFPSRTYIQGVIKGYGNFLSLDEEKLIAYFRRDYERRESLKFKRRADTSQFTPLSKRIVRIAIMCLVIFFGCFFGYQLFLFTVPPKITILEPTKSVFKLENRITIKGTAPKETIIMVNGRQAFLDDTNVFTIDVPLTEKKNLVTIEATGANGRKTILKKEYLKN